jgi:hypothetical protein
MAKPIDFLIEHRKTILKEYYRNEASAGKTWDVLQINLPKLKPTMSFNTFKQYLCVFIALSEKIRKQGEKESAKLIRQKDAELSDLRLKLKELEKRLSRLGQKSQNIEGWTVRLTSKGYYNLCKSFVGKVESIYIGKVFDEGKARKRIAERMSKLRQKGVIKP